MKLLLFIASALLVGTSYAQSKPGALSSGRMPAPIFLQKSGGQILEHKQIEGGLTMWTILKDGKRVAIYTTPDQKVMIVGTLFEASTGTNLSDKYVLQPNTPPATPMAFNTPMAADLMPATTAMQRDPLDYMRNTLQGIWDTPTGKAPAASAPVVYVFFDPLCRFCHALYRNTRHYIARGVTIKWIPVDALGPRSPPLSSSMLRGGKATLDRMADGGLTPVTASAEERKAIEANTLMATALASTIGKNVATPMIVYRERNDKLSVQFDDGSTPHIMKNVFWEVSK